MIVYKIDKYSHAKANAEVRNMMAVLAEIAPTLQSLHEVLLEHEAAISSPTISSFRNELQQLIVNAEASSRKIVENTQKLIAVSDQAGKHLAAIEEHFGSALRSKSIEEPAATKSPQPTK